MTESTWPDALRDYDITDEDIIVNVHQENPRRPNSIRSDIVTIETIPITLENGKEIRWWGITNGERGSGVRIWHFNDDDRMSDYRGNSRIGWSSSNRLIYKNSNGTFEEGLEKLKEYCQARLNGETVGE